MTTIQRGDRIRLLHMPDDPDPIPVGSTGTVTNVTDGPLGQISVKWDNGRTLILVPGVDQFEVIEHSKASAVQVPREVLDGIAAVRDSGMFNMMDVTAVAGLARQLGFDKTADWLYDRSNRSTYAEGIFRGFQPEE